jgi:hypothetical protein
MLYTRPEGFSVPAAGLKTTQEDWDALWRCEHVLDPKQERCTLCGRSAKRIEEQRG